MKDDDAKAMGGEAQSEESGKPILPSTASGRFVQQVAAIINASQQNPSETLEEMLRRHAKCGASHRSQVQRVYAGLIELGESAWTEVVDHVEESTGGDRHAAEDVASSFLAAVNLLHSLGLTGSVAAFAKEVKFDEMVKLSKMLRAGAGRAMPSHRDVASARKHAIAARQAVAGLAMPDQIRRQLLWRIDQVLMALDRIEVLGPDVTSDELSLLFSELIRTVPSVPRSAGLQLLEVARTITLANDLIDAAHRFGPEIAEGTKTLLLGVAAFLKH